MYYTTTQITLSWNEYIDEGIRLMHERKRNQFALGDLARDICGLPPRGRPATVNEDQMLPAYAHAIGARPGTLNDWRKFSDYWLHDMRDEFDDISYTMMRLAMRAGNRRYADNIARSRDFAVRLLRRAIDHDWPTWVFERLLYSGKGQPAQPFTFAELLAEWHMTPEQFWLLSGSRKRRADGRLVLVLEVG